MNVLLVYPKFPNTFWSFAYALWFVGKKAAYPPLGLLTVAALLPEKWHKRIVDMNVSKLTDWDIQGADYVFVSAMSVQQSSAREVISRCKKLGVKVVAGGPLFTTQSEDFSEVDYLVLGEAEITLPQFLYDLKKGCPKKLYKSEEWTDITKSPVPLFELVNFEDYVSMSVQYGRGCPHNCEFCGVVLINGLKVRTKSKEQVSAELNALYQIGWRGNIFWVDDNLIGNPVKLKGEILPAITIWSAQRSYPYTFSSQVSMKLADDPVLMKQLAKAGFDAFFVGIETANAQSLAGCGKKQNQHRDLMESVRKMQRAGFDIAAGFIFGFDQDPVNIFEVMISFIQESGVTQAMVGLLTALPGTRLHTRLKEEGRLLGTSSGDNTDGSLNFIPAMNKEVLVAGYQKVLRELYSPKNYYARIDRFFHEFNPASPKTNHLKASRIMAGIKSVFRLGIIGKERFYYWKLVFKVIFKRPKLLPMAVTLTILGFHFRKMFIRNRN